MDQAKSNSDSHRVFTREKWFAESGMAACWTASRSSAEIKGSLRLTGTYRWCREGELNLSRFAGVRARRRNPDPALCRRRRTPMQTQPTGANWCREGEMNPHEGGTSADFEAAASATSAIPAKLVQ